jgi:TfoX/Sxy family transcriptional regulator of competence genes
MAYQEKLADRIRELLDTNLPVEEKEMFQGLCFMVDDKLCICTRESHILCRIGEKQVEIELEKGNCRQMINNGRVMKDYVFVEDDQLKTRKDLTYWVKLCLSFNPKARSSKKKKK